MAKYVTTYRCNDCGHKFSVVRQRTDPQPECPNCEQEQPALPERIAAPAVVGTKSKAIDIAWDVAQKDFGLTNMNDRQKEGDIAYMPPPEKVNPATVTRPGFLWGGAGVQTTNPTGADAKAMLGGARLAAAQAKAEGRNPMQMLHQAKPKMIATPLNKGG